MAWWKALGPIVGGGVVTAIWVVKKLIEPKPPKPPKPPTRSYHEHTIFLKGEKGRWKGYDTSYP